MEKTYSLLSAIKTNSVGEVEHYVLGFAQTLHPPIEVEVSVETHVYLTRLAAEDLLAQLQKALETK